MKTLIKRHLSTFGLDLVWNGEEVLVMYKEATLLSFEAKTGIAAGRAMEQVEEDCFIAAGGMA